MHLAWPGLNAADGESTTTKAKRARILNYVSGIFANGPKAGAITSPIYQPSLAWCLGFAHLLHLSLRSIFALKPTTAPWPPDSPSLKVLARHTCPYEALPCSSLLATIVNQRTRPWLKGPPHVLEGQVDESFQKPISKANARHQALATPTAVRHNAIPPVQASVPEPRLVESKHEQVTVNPKSRPGGATLSLRETDVKASRSGALPDAGITTCPRVQSETQQTWTSSTSKRTWPSHPHTSSLPKPKRLKKGTETNARAPIPETTAIEDQGPISIPSLAFDRQRYHRVPCIPCIFKWSTDPAWVCKKAKAGVSCANCPDPKACAMPTEDLEHLRAPCFELHRMAQSMAHTGQYADNKIWKEYLNEVLVVLVSVQLTTIQGSLDVALHRVRDLEVKVGQMTSSAESSSEVQELSARLAKVEKQVQEETRLPKTLQAKLGQRRRSDPVAPLTATAGSQVEKPVQRPAGATTRATAEADETPEELQDAQEKNDKGAVHGENNPGNMMVALPNPQSSNIVGGEG
ncbi:hypothetical protein F66182_3232 [Fusarium sp. NRRL 66182]|nr:hypothetical protein F66182_3232 [Fusarium sp. NRRL 66182]